MTNRNIRFVLIIVLLSVFSIGVYAEQAENTNQFPGAIFQTLDHLENSYYAPDSVNYPKLLNIALASVQKKLQSKNIVINITPIFLEQSDEEAWKEFSAFWIAHVAQYETSDHQLEFTAIDSMLESFDVSHTRFMSSEELARIKERLENKAFGGAGIKLTEIENKVFVLEVFPGSPADIAGVLSFDQIVAVDDTTIVDINDAFDKIRGPARTTVILMVLRKQQLYDITVVRGNIQLPTLTTQLLHRHDNQILYVRLYSFATHKNLSYKLIDEYFKYIPIDGMIVDIRHNAGGFLQRVDELLEVFLPSARDLYIKRTATDTVIFTTSLGQIFAPPLVILINQETGSGSEIFSGVLQEQKRAVIVGQKSIGAVNIGEIKKLGLYNAAAMITTRQFFTAAGEKLEGVGVIPDIEADFTKDDIIAGRDPQLEKAIEALLELIDDKKP